MAKLAPKQTILKGAAPKGAAPNAPKADAVKEKAKADKQKLIESLATELAGTVSGFREAEEKSKNLFFDLADEVSAIAQSNSLEKADAREVLKLAMAEAYDVDADKITLEGNPTLYSNLSKIITLVFPANTIAKKALDKARAKGVTVNNALLIARGKLASAPVSGGKGKDATGAKAGPKKNGKDVIEDIEVFKNEFSALVARAIKGEYDTDALQEACAEILAQYEAGNEPAAE